jgi:hypothetical protein
MEKKGNRKLCIIVVQKRKSHRKSNQHSYFKNKSF